MSENELSRIIIGLCIDIHRHIGPGLYESIYEKLLVEKIRVAGLNAKRQHPIPLVHNGKRLGNAYKADIVVENKVIIELKSVRFIATVHKQQLLSYLRLSDLKLGLLINFNEATLIKGVTRIVNNLDESN